MVVYVIDWSCPFCGAANHSLSTTENPRPGIIGLNTHLRKLHDSTHGPRERYPKGWNPDDAEKHVTIAEADPERRTVPSPSQ